MKSTRGAPPRDRRVLQLGPGQILVGGAAGTVHTVLGSCVALVAVWRAGGVVGVTHAVLPHAPAAGGMVGRYVDSSVDTVLQRLQARGAALSQLQCKIFGGASLMPAREGSAQVGVGPANLEALLARLSHWGLHPTARDLGGVRGRRLWVRIPEGEVTVQRLSPSGDRP